MKASTLFGLNGSACCWCGEHLTAATVTREHLTPRHWGGGGGTANLAPACEPCNLDRGDRRAPPPSLGGRGQGWAAVYWRQWGEVASLVKQRREVLRLMAPEFAEPKTRKARPASSHQRLSRADYQRWLESRPSKRSRRRRGRRTS